MRRVRSYGIDLNPLATFVARTKTRSYGKSDLIRFRQLANESLSSFTLLRPAPLPPYPLLKKLFLPECLDILLRLKTYIDEVDSPRTKDLLLLAWLSILEQSSNVFKEGNGLKYRNKKRMPGKYFTLPDAEWIPRYFGDNPARFVMRQWASKCSEITQDLEFFRIPKGCTPRVRTGSCLDISTLDFDAPIDLAIFSPPYANRFDYFEAYKIELWMGGFVSSPEEMVSLRHRSLRNNLSAARLAPTVPWPPLAPFLSQMDEESSSVRMGIKPLLEGYFQDIRTLLRGLRSVLVKNGRVAIVVGNSAYARSIIPTDLLISALALEEGYSVPAIFLARQLHVSSQQRSHLNDLSRFMRESLLILCKS